MSAMPSQATGVSIVYSTVCSEKHQSSTSLSFVRRIHRRPENLPHKWPVTWKVFPYDDVFKNPLIFRSHWQQFACRYDCVRRLWKLLLAYWIPDEIGSGQYSEIEWLTCTREASTECYDGRKHTTARTLYVSQGVDWTHFDQGKFG